MGLKSCSYSAQTFFFSVQPSPQPKIDFSYHKYVPRHICLLICGQYIGGLKYTPCGACSIFMKLDTRTAASLEASCNYCSNPYNRGLVRNLNPGVKWGLELIDCLFLSSKEKKKMGVEGQSPLSPL